MFEKYYQIKFPRNIERLLGDCQTIKTLQS